MNEVKCPLCKSVWVQDTEDGVPVWRCGESVTIGTECPVTDNCPVCAERYRLKREAERRRAHEYYVAHHQERMSYHAEYGRKHRE